MLKSVLCIVFYMMYIEMVWGMSSLKISSFCFKVIKYAYYNRPTLENKPIPPLLKEVLSISTMKEVGLM